MLTRSRVAAVIVGLGVASGCSTARDENVGTSQTALTTLQQQKLTAPDPGPKDFFGHSVAVSGNTAVVGSWFDDIGTSPDQGSAYVLTRTGSSWSLQQKLTAGGSLGYFGSGVAIADDTIVVGARFSNPRPNGSRGAAYVFQRTGSSWAQQAVLVPSSPESGEVFGEAVALSGNTLLVSGFAAYVFVRSGSVWSEQQRIPGSANGVALSGETALVADRRANVGSAHEQGSVRVFVRSGSTWAEQQLLTASDGEGGDNFGTSVAISGDVALVGSARDQVSGVLRGSAYFFRRSGSTWTEEQKVINSDGAFEDDFGQAVALSGDLAVIGAPRHEHQGVNENHGAAYVFLRSGSSWVEDREVRASDGQNNDFFGKALAISENTLIAGADNDDNPQPAQGAAYAFVFNGAVGEPCAAGSGCTSGFCSDGRCCDSACEGSCNACSVSAGAPRDGQCMLLPAGSPGSPPCAPSVCTGTSPLCGASSCESCASDLDCASGKFCSSIGVCYPQKTRGRACEPEAGADCRAEGCRVCETGFCVDGFCCETACTEESSACSHALTGAPNGTCAGATECGGSGGSGSGAGGSPAAGGSTAGGSPGAGGTSAGGATGNGGASGLGGSMGTSGGSSGGFAGSGGSSGASAGSAGTSGAGGSPPEDCEGVPTGDCPCVYVSPDGDDTLAAANGGETPFRNVQPAIDFASTHAGSKKVCVAAGANCGAVFSYAGPLNGEFVMHDGVSVYGAYESTTWNTCDDSQVVLSGTATPALRFGPDIDSPTELYGLTVEAQSTDMAVGIDVDGAVGASLRAVEVAWQLGSEPSYAYAVDISNGADVTILGSRIRTTTALREAVALRSRGSTVEVDADDGNPTVLEAHGRFSVYTVWLEDPGDSRIENSVVDAIGEPRSPTLAVTVVAIQAQGDLDGLAITSNDISSVMGEMTTAMQLNGLGDDDVDISSNHVHASANPNEGDSGANGIFVGGCRPTLRQNQVVVVGFGTGLQCSGPCVLTQNDVHLENEHRVQGVRQGGTGVVCMGCERISENSISGLLVVRDCLRNCPHRSVGLDVSGTGTLVDRNFINGGCSGDPIGIDRWGSVGVRAAGSIRLENNQIWGGSRCPEQGGATSVGVIIGQGAVDLHSNAIAGGDGCRNSGLIVGGQSATIRNNIIQRGFCASGAHIEEADNNSNWFVLENNNFVPASSGQLYLDRGGVDPATIADVNAIADVLSFGNFAAECRSSCIDAGTPAGAPSDDFNGSPRSSSSPDTGPIESGNLEHPDVCVGITCMGPGTCARIGLGPRCVCEPGYVNAAGDPFTCVDFNECLVNNGGCGYSSTCTNTIGGSVCTP